MTNEQHLEALSRLSHGLTRAAEGAVKAFSTTLIPAIQKAQPAINQVAKLMEQAMWEAYGRAGMPYGESQEGLRRWLDEQD